MFSSTHTRRALVGTAAASALTLALAPAALADETDDDAPGRWGRATDVPHGFVGAHLFPSSDGAVVVRVIDGSPAADAGIEMGDIVVSINGVEVDQRGAVRDALAGAEPGDSLTVVYVSDGDTETATVVVGDPDDRPEPPAREDVPWTGVRLERRSADAEGAVVRMVIAGSPADDAGLAAGDVITEIDGTSVDTWWEAQAALHGAAPGDTVVVGYARDGVTAAVKVELGSADQSPVPERPGPRGEGERPGHGDGESRGFGGGDGQGLRERVMDAVGAVAPWAVDD